MAIDAMDNASDALGNHPQVLTPLKPPLEVRLKRCAGERQTNGGDEEPVRRAGDKDMVIKCIGEPRSA